MKASSNLFYELPFSEKLFKVFSYMVVYCYYLEYSMMAQYCNFIYLLEIVELDREDQIEVLETLNAPYNSWLTSSFSSLISAHFHKFY